MQPVITERLLIRRMALTDLQDLLAFQTHPDNLRYQAIEPMTEDKAVRYLEKQTTLDVENETGWIAFAVELRDVGRMIGEMGLYISPPPENKGDLGWSLHPDYQGRGYGTEAARVLLTFAFGVRALHRVTSSCDSRNVASFRLMERIGLRREAHFQQSHFNQGVWSDEYVYALLRSEWRPLEPGSS